MSTILDALRKLQRERTAANPSRDLRGSVTDEIPTPQPRRSPPRRGLALGVLAACLAILVGVGGTWLYKRGVFSRGAAAPAEVAAEQEEPGGDVPTEAELDELERETAAHEAAAEARGEAPPPVAASPNPPPEVPAANADEAAERARLEEVRRAAAAAEAERQQAEAKAAADAAAEAAADAATAVDVQPPPPAPAPPAQMQAQAPKAAAATAVAPPPKPVAKPKPAPKAKPAPPPARRPPPPPDSRSDAAADALAPTAFPEVRVESIRWHPLAERRAASLRFAQQNVADAHEGDIVGGVLVFRIEPGAVELRVGSTSRVVRPGP